MGIEIITFIFGGLLLLTGIIGGGFEVKELKIPTVAMGPRVIASIAGLAFIIVGISISGKSTSTETGENTETNESYTQDETGTGAAEFTINSKLAEDAISEQVAILIDGKIVGNLTASRQYPESMITVNLPQEGSYSYSVEGSITYDVNGEEQNYSCVGQGYINVVNGKSFNVGVSFSGETILVTLTE